MIRCRRCRVGCYFRDLMEELSCLQCGYVDYGDGFVPIPLEGENSSRRRARLPEYDPSEVAVRRKKQRREAKTRERAKAAHERFLEKIGGFL